MNNKTLIWVIVVLVILVGGYLVFFQGDQQTSEPVQVEEDFGTKVVYTTNMEADPAPLRADCELRGGTFNECGSICAPDADFCAEVCAYTCDDIPSDESDTATTTDDEQSTSTDEEATTTDEE